MIRKIAISGMKGRKKDLFLLSFVVLLSFLFIITSTIFYSSSERTKNIQRTNMFGKWHSSYLSGDESIEKKILDTNDVAILGNSRILGKSDTLGFVGTFNKELFDMAHFQMYEGRFPEDDNEIALELNQLSYFSKDVKVGDTIPVEIVISLVERDIETVNIEQIRKLDFQKHETSTMLYDYFQGEKKKLGLEEHDQTPMEIFYSINMNRLGRNEPTLEVFDGTRVVIKTSYLYFSIGENSEKIEDNIEKIKKDGSILSQSAVITKDMVVSGIIQTYSNLWDVDKYPVVNSFVTENAGKSFLEGGFYMTKELDVSHYNAPVNYFILSKSTPEGFYHNNKNELANLRKNNFAYPDTGASTESTLTYCILGFIFIATMFSVFQIYLTQMKRRTRKIALLKSIGATNKQVRGILVWEVIYLLAFCIPVSILGGILIVRLILLGMNSLGNGNITFYMDYNLVIFGIIAGILSVIIGITIPMIKSMKIPLTGNISKPPRHKKSLARDRLKLKFTGLNMKIQTFGKISIRNAKYNRGNILLTLSLYTITIAVLLGSIFLSFLAFGDYIDKVIVTDKPDYGFEFDYGMRNRGIPEFLEELKSIKGVEKVELYKAGEHAYLWYEGIENNIIQSTFKQIIPLYLMDKHFGENDYGYENVNDNNKHLIRDSVVVNTYCIDPADEIFNRFEDAITVGSIDHDKFNDGKEVIVLMPHYFPNEINNDKIYRVEDNSIIENTEQKTRIKQLLEYGNIYDMNYDFRNSEFYLNDKSLEVGDTIKLTIPKEQVRGDKKTNEVAFHELKVGAIINYFPEKGIWPFSDTIENPVIIGSYNLIVDLYPASLTGKGSLSTEDLKNLISSFTPTKYGKTWVYVDIDNKSDNVQIQVEIQRLAIEKESKLSNYIESNNIIFGKAFRIASIIVILGVSVALIALIILYNTSLSKLEQERERIGTLQAMGVTGGQFKKLYLLMGFLYGMISLILAHIFMSSIVLLTTVGDNGTLILNIINQLWLYPWRIHGIVCLIFFVTTVLTYYLPLGKILKNQPIDNIRSLNS